MKDNKNKNKIIGLSIGILVVLIIVVSSTYAYWQITKSQKDPNSIVAACLDIDMQSVDGTFALDPAWPISDYEGYSLKGYTFKVTNNCEEVVSYVIGMDSLEVSGVEYLDYNNIKVSLDNDSSLVYGDQEDIDHIEENDTYTIRDSKKINTATVAGKVGDTPGSNTHNVKVWIKSDAPVEEQSKVFSGRMFITGGQKIVDYNQPTAESCFEITEEGEIIGYDEACGSSAVIPATVNGVAVKTIDSDAFKYKAVVSKYSLDGKAIENIDMTNVNFAFVQGEDGPLYAITYTTDEEILLGIKELTTGLGLNEESIYASTDDNIPQLNVSEMKIYVNFVSQENSTVIGIETLEEDTILSINSLDLSKANYIEVIEPGSFSNIELEEITSNSCTYKDAAQNEYDDVSEIPTGLTNLKFGKQAEIKIGSGAFAGLKTDELNIYTNIKGYSECPDQIASFAFVGSTINTLNVYSLDNNSVFDPGAWLLAIIPDNNTTINIMDGVTEIGDGAFMLTFFSNLNLPNSLQKIGDSAFASAENTTTPLINVTMPYNVTSIGEEAFYYRKGTITFLRTKEDVEANVSLGKSWQGKTTVIYAE